MKAMRSENNLLARELKINEEEPFLNAYFSRESKDSKPKGNFKNEGFFEKKVQIQRKIKNRSNKFPLEKESPSIKKFSVKDKADLYGKGNPQNEFISVEKLEKVRKNYSISEPSDPADWGIEPKRVNSVKRIIENYKISKVLNHS